MGLMKKNKVIGIIPARYASTRLPAKPLALIAGKTLIERVWRQVIKSRQLSDVYIATDDKRIADKALSFGAKVVMTSSKCKTGTDRISQAANKIGGAKLFVNIQGDEPLIDPKTIDTVAAALANDKESGIVTAAYPVLEQEIISPNTVKVVVDKKGFALYFSRSVIPFNRTGVKIDYLKHQGIYGYKKSFLDAFTTLPQSSYEKAESLEQLRALENGYKIKIVLVKSDSIGVDTPEDILKVEGLLNGKQ